MISARYPITTTAPAIILAPAASVFGTYPYEADSSWWRRICVPRVCPNLVSRSTGEQQVRE
jgi:hypothetical protein